MRWFDLADTKVHNQDVSQNSMSPWAALFEVIALVQARSKTIEVRAKACVRYENSSSGTNMKL